MYLGKLADALHDASRAHMQRQGKQSKRIGRHENIPAEKQSAALVESFTASRNAFRIQMAVVQAQELRRIKMVDQMLKAQLEGFIRSNFKHFLSLRRLNDEGFCRKRGRYDESENFLFFAAGNRNELNFIPSGGRLDSEFGNEAKRSLVL